MIQNSSSKKDPLIYIIEKGIEFWIRSQCKSIKNINLELAGSTLQLLSGKLLSIRLIANEANFKELPLHHIEIYSGPLQIEFSPSNKQQKISLSESFSIKGFIALTSKGLNQLISATEWAWIREWLSIELLEAKHLESITINEDIFELEYSSLDDKYQLFKSNFEVKASSGTILFKDKSKEILLPMDPSIQIENVTLRNGEMLLSGYAKVNP